MHLFVHLNMHTNLKCVHAYKKNRILNPKQIHFILPMTYNEITIASLSLKDFKQIKTRSKEEKIPECFEIWKPSKCSLT